MAESAEIKDLILFAEESGATRVKILPSEDIKIEDRLAEICRDPGCPGYGLSASCPPYVSGPKEFRRKISMFPLALFFKIDVPFDLLLSAERRELYQFLHQTASGIEIYAMQNGFQKAAAFAGASCKKIFCHEYLECAVVSKGESCRFPDQPRPSMSGFGINVGSLIELSGWDMEEEGLLNEVDKSGSMSYICGLVLLKPEKKAD